MIKEAIEHLLSLGDRQIQSANGRTYVFVGDELRPLPSPAAEADALEFHSLSGLVDYLAAGFDKESNDSLAIVIDGPGSVSLVKPLTQEFRQRGVLAHAEPYVAAGFGFGRFMDLESFITALQSCFVQDDQTAAILKVVGNVTSEAVQAFSDDGVTQSVTARAGIAKVANVVVPNPVSLRPFRTFPECWRQPESKYVLRVRRGKDGELPAAALFEVGDEQWKHEAIKLIKSSLTSLLADSGTKVRIFA